MSIIVEIKPGIADKRALHLGLTDDELAKSAVENGRMPDLRRTVRYELGVREDNVAMVAVNPEYDSHGWAEYISTKRVYDFFDEGDDLVFWVSPSDDLYPTGRLNIYYKDGDIDIGIALVNRWTEKDNWWIVGELMGNGGITHEGITSFEKIRENPIAFNLDGKNWLEYCREILPSMEETWAYLENGQHVKEEANTLKMIKQARKDSGDNMGLFVLALRGMGRELLTNENHGSVMGISEVGHFSLQRVGGEIMVSLIEKNGQSYCPLCGAKVGSHELTCSVCKAKIKRD